MSIHISTHQTTHPAGQPASQRSVIDAMLRGVTGRCPACGTGNVFRAYLKVTDHCPACGEGLHHHRADDAPPYFTILIVGHLVVGGVLALEQSFAPQAWLHAIIWVPLTLALSLTLLPRIKGALVGLQWALRMHGFDAGALDPAGPLPIDDAAASPLQRSPAEQ